MASRFSNDLTEFETKFESLKPEFELVTRDDELGIEGYVVVWNTLASRGGPLPGIGKGGTRITTSVSLEEVGRLAKTMTLKNAAAGLPLGGAKSGLRADPTAPDFEKHYRRYVRLCAPSLRSNGGPYGGFGFDLGGNPIHARWACDELGSTDCITGKPLDLGGTDYDREGIAGFGVVVAAETLLKQQNIPIESATFSVQGLGAMGSAVLRFMCDIGAKPRCVSDLRIGGTWTLPDSIDSSVLDLLQSGDFATARPMLEHIADGPSDVNAALFADVDIIFPAAIQDVLTADNAKQVRAKYVVEAANFPSTPEALKIFNDNEVIVVPDIIANPGGIIAAFVELTSTVSPEENVRDRVNPERAKQLTKEKISANVSELLVILDRESCLPHEAAKYLALRNIFH